MISRKVARKLTQLIENRSKSNNVLLIEGARQVGKTTLVHQVLKETSLPYQEVNLEENKSLSQKIDLCGGFSEFTELLEVELQFSPGKASLLFIDEAQESRQLGSFVRFMKEKWENTLVILSGSSMSRIFHDDVRYPVGRVTPLLVQPFSFEEFLMASNEPHLLKQLEGCSQKKILSANTHHRLVEMLQHYLEVGGLPEVVITYFKGGAWKELRKNILYGYYQDFKRVYGDEKQSVFIASLQASAHLLGQPFKNSFVSRLLDGGKNQEIIKTLSQLEAWRMITKVNQRGSSEEQNFHPKRYLFDGGIAKELRESVMPKTHLLYSAGLQRNFLGGLVENLAANLLLFLDPQQELNGWKRNVSGSEIDFVLQHANSVMPVECKATLKVKNSHLGGVRHFMELYQIPLGVVTSLAPFEIRNLPEGRQLILLPLYLLERLYEIVEGINPLNKQTERESMA